MKWEWRKQEKALYAARQTPALVEVPPQNFILIHGSGDPNGADFSARVSALYTVAYAVKKAFRAAAAQQPEDAVRDFTVYPLEGVWRLDHAAESAAGPLVKENLEYAVMIRQPDGVSAEMVRAALEQAQRKKPSPLYEAIAFAPMHDGACVAMLHMGAYDAEPASFAQMDRFAAAHGLRRAADWHREIYLTGRASPDRLKTILRYPVKPL